MIARRRILTTVLLSLVLLGGVARSDPQRSKLVAVDSEWNEAYVSPNGETREPVPDSTRDFNRVPWKSICKIVARFKTGETREGTGTLVGKHHVLTAAHTVFDSDLGGWATRVEVIPAYNLGKRPFGSSMKKSMIAMKRYTEDGDLDCDVAFIITKEDIGSETGWFGIKNADDEQLKRTTVHIAGYPSDRFEGQSLQYTHGKIDQVEDERLYYLFNTWYGMSGAGIFVSEQTNLNGPPERYVVAVHTMGGKTANSGVRIRDDIWDWIRYCLMRSNSPLEGRWFFEDDSELRLRIDDGGQIKAIYVKTTNDAESSIKLGDVEFAGTLNGRRILAKDTVFYGNSYPCGLAGTKAYVDVELFVSEDGRTISGYAYYPRYGKDCESLRPVRRSLILTKK